jgi:hypothetical protein
MPDEVFDNESGEDQEVGTEVADPDAEAEETEEPEPERPKVKQVPLAELQAERQSRQRLEQELHALRMQAAQFQFNNQQQQQAVLDPQMDELRKILKPIMDAELAPERERRMALERSVAQYEQVIQADTNIRIIQNELGSDWDTARPLMTEYLESRSERTRNAILENPDLFIEKARELIEKSNSPKSVAKAVLKSKIKHESGDAPRAAKPAFDPATASEKQFNDYLRSRGIL